MARIVEGVIALLRRADGPDPWVQRYDNLARRIRRGHVRVAAQVRVGQNIMPKWPRILRAEPVTPVVAVAPELGRPALRLQFAGVGPETEVARAHGHFRAGAL